MYPVYDIAVASLQSVGEVGRRARAARAPELSQATLHDVWPGRELGQQASGQEIGGAGNAATEMNECPGDWPALPE